MRISDWSSAVCSSDLHVADLDGDEGIAHLQVGESRLPDAVAVAGGEGLDGGAELGAAVAQHTVAVAAVERPRHLAERRTLQVHAARDGDRKSTRLNSSH